MAADVVLLLLPLCFSSWFWILPFSILIELSLLFSEYSRLHYPFFRLTLAYRWLGDVVVILITDFAGRSSPRRFATSAAAGVTIRFTAMATVSTVLTRAHLVPPKFGRILGGWQGLACGLMAISLTVSLNAVRIVTVHLLVWFSDALAGRGHSDLQLLTDAAEVEVDESDAETGTVPPAQVIMARRMLGEFGLRGSTLMWRPDRGALPSPAKAEAPPTSVAISSASASSSPQAKAVPSQALPIVPPRPTATRAWPSFAEPAHTPALAGATPLGPAAAAGGLGGPSLGRPAPPVGVSPTAPVMNPSAVAVSAATASAVPSEARPASSRASS